MDPDSTIRLLIGDAFQNILYAYLDAIEYKNKKSISIISSMMTELLWIHSRKTSESNLYQVSRPLCIDALDTTLEILDRALKNDTDSPLTLPLTVYNNMLFLPGDVPFDLRLLPAFNDFLRKVAEQVAKSESCNLMESFVGYLYDGPKFSANIAKRPLDILSLLNNCDCADRLRKLDYEFQLISDVLQLKNFTDNFYSFMDEVVSKKNSSAQISSACAEVIIAAEGWLKLNLLREVLLDLCGWCLMENRIGFIVALWDYHQPPDATATFGENPLLPGDALKSLRNYLLVRRPHDRDWGFGWRGHRGKGAYINQYIIWHLLAAITERLEQCSWAMDRTNTDIVNSLLECLKDDNDHYDTEGVYSLQSDCELLLSVAHTIVKNNDIDRLTRLGFKLLDDTHPVEKYVKPLLVCLAERTKTILQVIPTVAPLSPGKMDEFAGRISRGFEENFSLARICMRYAQQVEDEARLSDLSQTLTYKQWLPRESLIEGWYVDYSSIGSSYGSEVARQADVWILRQMYRLAKKISFDDFFIQSKTDASEWIMFSEPMGLGDQSIWREYFQGFVRFSDEEHQIPGYRGEYGIGARKVTAHYINSPFPLPFSGDNVLVIPKTMLGEIDAIAYEPATSTEVDWEFQRQTVNPPQKLWIGIGKVNQATQANLLHNPPPWLQDVSDATDPEDWLQNHMVLNVETTIRWKYPSEQTLYLVRA